MGLETGIEWTDATVNWWWGCTKVSPGCARCYAHTLAGRFRKDIWGAGKPREDHRKGARVLATRLEKRSKKKLEKGEGRLRVFCSSMADLLAPEVPVDWLADALDDIRRMPHCHVQILTKRPESWRNRLTCVVREASLSPGRYGDLVEWVKAWLHGEAPCNVWMGTTVEDQMRANKRIPDLLRIPAVLRFLSCEPLLEGINLYVLRNSGVGPVHVAKNIHWVICGGESGGGARPLQPDWVRSLRDQCADGGIPFFFKQWGAWLPVGQAPAFVQEGHPFAPTELRERGGRVVFDQTHQSYQVGKSLSGNLLDGTRWNGFPAVG